MALAGTSPWWTNGGPVDWSPVLLLVPEMALQNKAYLGPSKTQCALFSSLESLWSNKLITKTRNFNSNPEKKKIIFIQIMFWIRHM